MDVNDLPLLELFTKLREAGLPLGIDEYQLVLQAMQAGFGINDQAALKRLCQTLWVKSAEEKRLFEYHFEQVMSSEVVLETAKTLFLQSQLFKITRYAILGILAVGIALGVPSSSQDPTQTIDPTWTKNFSPLPATKQEIAQIQSQKDTNQQNLIFWSLLLVFTLSSGYILFRWLTKRNAKKRIAQINLHLDVTSSPAKLTQIIEDEVQVAQAVLQVTSTNIEIAYSRFILTTEYFPVTKRQMKQIWRYLRRPVREGLQTELDVEATVNLIGHQGLILEPVLVPPRVNQSELLLLIDQDGSMVPFHQLSQRLAETASRGGRLGKSGIYYFHNCPIEYLYHDRYHQKAKSIIDVVNDISSDRTAVLICSDAGAARGGYNEERYKLTKEFITHLKQRVRYVAWLNPMPRKRWYHTTAGEIAHLLPMFELNREGLQDAIHVLRGKHARNFEV
ncbi:hypothetical protein [Nostoc sp.]|uniref:hypothetical protein n=1 Tax=Nostoc sp. TaxID=1180 RepID=UPI002FF9928D